MCGSRGWHDPHAVETVIAGLDILAEGRAQRLVIVHGDNKGGADALADKLGRRWGVDVIPVPAQWNRYGRGAGPMRNQQMLDEHPDIEQVWAFRSQGKSNGTDDMVSRGKASGVPTYIVTEA